MKIHLVACSAALAALVIRVSAQLPGAAQPFATPLFGPTLSVSGPADNLWSSTIQDGVKFIVRRAGNTPYDVQAMSDRSRVAVHIGDVLFESKNCSGWRHMEVSDSAQ